MATLRYVVRVGLSVAVFIFQTRHINPPQFTIIVGATTTTAGAVITRQPPAQSNQKKRGEVMKIGRVKIGTGRDMTPPVVFG